MSSDKIEVITPKSIVQSKALYYLEYELNISAKFMIFYSVERKPTYGKKYYGEGLPRDVLK